MKFHALFSFNLQYKQFGDELLSDNALKKVHIFAMFIWLYLYAYSKVPSYFLNFIYFEAVHRTE